MCPEFAGAQRRPPLGKLPTSVFVVAARKFGNAAQFFDCGILIKGRRAIYENTLCRFEGDVYAAWFSGELRCPYIDVLAKEYDDRMESGLSPSSDNPLPIITRTRDGLQPEHPFVQALRSAIEKPLGDVINKQAEREKEEGDSLSEEAHKRLILAEDVASWIFDEEMRELEAEDLPDDGCMPPTIAIYPPEANAYIGEKRTLTVTVRKNGFAEGDDVTVSLDPLGVVECERSVIQLKTTSHRPDILVAQIRLEPMLADEPTIVTASISDESATALVNVKAEREMIEEELDPPDTFQFARPVYRVGWQKRKDLELVAPVDVVAEHGTSAPVQSNDAGVVRKGSGVVKLSLDDKREYYCGSVAIEARNLNVNATLLICRGGRSRVSAITQTPASGPLGPVTTPAMSSVSIGTAAPGGWPACRVTSETASTATVTTPMLLRENMFRAIFYLLVRRSGSKTNASGRILSAT